MRLSSLLVVVGLLCLAVGIALPAQAGSHQNQCSVPGQIFASCAEDARAFNSVVVAIHGWGGTCNATFGDKDVTLFTHLLDGGFFDVDCFQYETKEQDILTSVAALRAQVIDLKLKGYNQFEFVTHSLGGVVLLRLLVDDYLDDNKTALRPAIDPNRLFDPATAAMASASIWASPINGVRPDIQDMIGAAEILRIISEHSRMALAQDGVFLTTLRSDIVKLGELWSQASLATRENYPLPLRFHHGQGEDWVVNPIVLQEPWIIAYPEKTLFFDNSAVGHSENVGDPEHLNFAKFPVTLIELEQLLTLKFAPRIEEVFPLGSASVPESMVTRRKRVVQAATSYTHSQFEKAVRPLRGLLARVVESGYFHAAQTDEALMAGLLEVVSAKESGLAARPADRVAYIRFADELLCDTALKDFNANQNKQTDFSGSHATAKQLLLDLLKRLSVTSRNLMIAEPALKFESRKCGGEENMMRTAMAPQLRALDAQSDPVFKTALSNLEEMVPIASESTLDELKVTEQVLAFAMRKTNGLPEDTAPLARSILMAATSKSIAERLVLLGRSAEISEETGKPVFAQVLNDPQIDFLLESIRPAQALNVEIEFARTALQNSGASGSSSAITAKAGRIVLDAAAARSVAERKPITDGLITDQLKLNFPTISRRLDRRIIELQR